LKKKAAMDIWEKVKKKKLKKGKRRNEWQLQ